MMAGIGMLPWFAIARPMMESGPGNEEYHETNPPDPESPFPKPFAHQVIVEFRPPCKDGGYLVDDWHCDRYPKPGLGGELQELTRLESISTGNPENRNQENDEGQEMLSLFFKEFGHEVLMGQGFSSVLNRSNNCILGTCILQRFGDGFSV